MLRLLMANSAIDSAAGQSALAEQRDTELLRDESVDSLDGPICSRVERDCRGRFYAEGGTEIDPIVRDDTTITVRAQNARESVKSEHV